MLVATGQQVIAVNVNRAAFIYRVNPNAAASSFVAILAKTPVSVPAHLVLRSAEITATTRCAKQTVVIAASHVKNSATGSVRISIARSLVENHATDQDAMSHAKRSYSVNTCVSVFAVKNVQSCAEFVTKTLKNSAVTGPKLCLWNWWTVVMYLK